MDLSCLKNIFLMADMVLKRSPEARAMVKGSAAHPEIEGTVSFYETGSGVIVLADFKGLPVGQGPCPGGVFGFHIHEGGSCSGNEKDPLADVGGHYNPGKCPHPYHAGDLPPLFGNNGMAWMAFLTDRFTVGEVLDRTVIVHGAPDDFTTQPSGNSGEKIACGVIKCVECESD